MYGVHGVHSAGTGVNDVLGFFGIKGAGIGIAIDSLTGNTSGVLSNLYDKYLETAMGRGSGPIERMMGGGYGAIPPFLGMPSPMSMYPSMMPFAGGGYGGGFQTIDLAAGSTNIPILSKLFSGRRRAAGRFERMLRTNPHARAQFEASIGGRITHFGLRGSDGKFTVQRHGMGMGGMNMAAFNPMMGTALAPMMAMQQGFMGYAGGMGMMPGAMGGMPFFGANSFYQNPFMGFTMGGLMNAAGMQAPSGRGYGPFDNSGPLGGRAFGSFNPAAMPGNINNTNPAYEYQHQAETARLLADPSLTVEDKVTLLIMLIMKKMDKDIENQAQYINSIQQQQSSRGGQGGGKGGKVGGSASGMFGGGPFAAGTGGGQGQNSPSIDVETMKLKRMIDKRSQMFDMLRQIIDKYNQTAKGIIDSIGR